MRTPSYLEVTTQNGEKEIIHRIRHSRFILGIFILLFGITGIVGAGFALSGTDNPAYLIVSIVSGIIVVFSLLYLGFDATIRIDTGAGILEITKTYFSRKYRQEQLFLKEIEKVLYEESPYIEGSRKSYLSIVDTRGKHLLFTGDSWLKKLGEDLAKELGCEFV